MGLLVYLMDDLLICLAAAEGVWPLQIHADVFGWQSCKFFDLSGGLHHLVRAAVQGEPGVWGEPRQAGTWFRSAGRLSSAEGRLAIGRMW